MTMQKSVLQNIEKVGSYVQKNLLKIPFLAILPFFEGFYGHNSPIFNILLNGLHRYTYLDKLIFLPLNVVA